MHNVYQRVGENLYNDVVKYFARKSYFFPPPHPVYIRLKWMVINLILKFDDPIVNVYVGKTKLKMKLSQKNPYYHVTYSIFAAQPRIAKKIANTENDGLFMIEIGSNIGDTASLIMENIPASHLLCVEGADEYLKFLKLNLEKYDNVFIEPTFCVDELDNNTFSVNVAGGTAVLIKNDTSKITNVNTLDDIIKKYPTFHIVNFLKVDASGAEILILNGAKNILSQKPLLYIHFAPELYVRNGQSPMELMEILYSYGYTKTLFYTNFGFPVGIFDITDKERVQELINKIDKKTIFYYSLLTVSDDKYDTYLSFFDSELNFYKNT
jgi:FkbM family methyltransferase